MAIFQYLLNHTDESHPAIITELLAYLESRGIHANRKTVATDIRDLQEAGWDIICNRGRQNQYFIGDRGLELPELREHGCSPESAIIEINPDGSFTRTEYIPEASRFTWSGKLSPDGTQIAFLSCITEVTYDDKPTELFIGSVDGSEPTKVPCELPDTEHEKNHNGIYTMAYGDPSDVHYYCAIVGWK